MGMRLKWEHRPGRLGDGEANQSGKLCDEEQMDGSEAGLVPEENIERE